MTENTAAVVAPVSQEMMNRGEERAENVMESIHSIKIYNCPPGEVSDPNLDGHLMIKNNTTEGTYKKFVASVGMNILKVRKAINGSYPLRDENGEKTMDNNGNAKRGFAFTEEYGRFSRNTDEIFFKRDNQVIRTGLGNLKTMLKTEVINKMKNPFYKACVSKDGEAYDGSFLKDSYIIYGVFTDGEYAGEYFRLFLTNFSFGITWRGGAKCDPDAGSLAAGLSEGFKLFNEYKEVNGVQGRFDDSLLTTTVSAIKDGNYYKANFGNVALVFPKDNTEDFNFIEELIKEYKRTTFASTGGDYVKLAEPKEEAKAIEQPVNAVQTDEVTPANFQPNTAPVKAVPPSDIQQPAPDPVVAKPGTTTKVDVNDGISIEDIPF